MYIFHFRVFGMLAWSMVRNAFAVTAIISTVLPPTVTSAVWGIRMNTAEENGLLWSTKLTSLWTINTAKQRGMGGWNCMRWVDYICMGWSLKVTAITVDQYAAEQKQHSWVDEKGIGWSFSAKFKGAKGRILDTIYVFFHGALLAMMRLKTPTRVSMIVLLPFWLTRGKSKTKFNPGKFNHGFEHWYTDVEMKLLAKNEGDSSLFHSELITALCN